MKTWLYFLLLIFSEYLFAQTVYEYKWGATDCLIPKASSQKIIHLQNWQMTVDGNKRNVHVPFVVSKAQKIQVNTSFGLVKKNIYRNIFLFSGGIKGSATIYLNKHLISFIGNAQQPFKIALPVEFLNDDSLQYLTLKMKQPQSAKEGFPQIVYTYSESHVIGLPAPLCIVVKSFPFIDQFRHKLHKKGAGFTLAYSYRLNLSENFTRIQIDEIFQNSKNGQMVFKKIRFIKNFNGRSLTVKGEFPINAHNLWSPENPQHIIFRLNIKLFGKQKESASKTFKFGARLFQWHKGKFYLNGVPTTIRGINYHQNFRSLSQINYHQKLLADLLHIKALDINSVRIAHFLPDQNFLHLTDSLGILVFAEFPLWRFPESFFSENYLLELAKNICLQMAPFYRNHSSLVAIGLGQEIPIHDPITQKFIFILNGKVKSLLNVLTYVSPILGQSLPPEKVSDFYVFDRYYPLYDLKNSQAMQNFALLGKIGVLTADLFKQEKKGTNHEMNRSYFLKEEIGKALFGLKTAGGFIESFQDWFSPYPSLVSERKTFPYIIPQGLYYVNAQPKPWVKLLDDPWQVDKSALTQTKPKGQRPTNFFSILITLSVVLFFSLYRRMPRLKENLKRSLRHSYGFFVDLRERRIIPLLNSIIVGIFFSLIIAVFISSQIYFYHNSYWLQEVMAIFFVPLGLFNQYLKISQSYWLLTLTLFLIFFLLPLLGAFVVKIFAGFSRAKIRLRQGIAIMYWSGTPFLWFFPVSLISYHWVFYHQNTQILWIFFALLILWVHIRMIKGLRILFLSKASTVFITLLLCYSVPVLIFWAIFNPPGYWFDYFKLLMEAKALF